jgi:hypothetical protein
VDGEGTAQSKGAPAQELALRLLVYAAQVHTEQGRHELRLESWDHWTRRVHCPMPLPADEGRERLTQAATSLGAAPTLLPWLRRRTA